MLVLLNLCFKSNFLATGSLKPPSYRLDLDFSLAARSPSLTCGNQPSERLSLFPCHWASFHVRRCRWTCGASRINWRNVWSVSILSFNLVVFSYQSHLPSWLAGLYAGQFGGLQPGVRLHEVVQRARIPADAAELTQQDCQRQCCREKWGRPSGGERGEARGKQRWKHHHLLASIHSDQGSSRRGLCHQLVLGRGGWGGRPWAGLSVGGKLHFYFFFIFQFFTVASFGLRTSFYCPGLSLSNKVMNDLTCTLSRRHRYIICYSCSTRVQ